MRRRYVIYGAGAVGGTIAGLLARAGREVAIVARGSHGEVLRDKGLALHRPDGPTTVSFAEVVGAPANLTWRPDDIVIMAMKTQDAFAAFDALRASTPATVSVVCAQNGVENERTALRRFGDVHGMCVMLPATHLEAGVVVSYGAPAAGILDLGRIPHGTDETDDLVAADLREAGFSSEAQPAILRWKYAKLRLNLGNAIEAVCGRVARQSSLFEDARDEADACFAAARIEAATEEEDRERRADIMRIAPVDGQERGGGSSWQSLARATGSIETDYLNGEVVLLGRRHGVPVPVNAGLQRVAARFAGEKARPGSLSIEQLREEIRRMEPQRLPPADRG